MSELLDDAATIERLDPHGMLARVESLPEQCEAAWKRAQELEVPPGHAGAQDVVLLGMGGSAIAGDILRSLSAPTGSKTVRLVRGYDLPASVGESTLVVACSHSGNTEETLSAFQQALTANAKTFAVTMGGRLQQLAEEAAAPVFRYEYDGEPRSAIGHQLMALLVLGEQADLLHPQEAAVAEAVSLMREQRPGISFAAPATRNSAKQIALRLHGRLPVVIGAGALAVAAYRWKTQINENSKSWALCEELPELDHNSIVGFGLPDVSRLHAIFLCAESLHERMGLRYQATAEALAHAGVSHETINGMGLSPLSQLLTLIYFGDLASFYLALLNDVQPATVGPIDALKAKLAER